MELGLCPGQDTVAGGAQYTQSVDNDAAPPPAIWTVKERGPEKRETGDRSRLMSKMTAKKMMGTRMGND